MIMQLVNYVMGAFRGNGCLNPPDSHDPSVGGCWIFQVEGSIEGKQAALYLDGRGTTVITDVFMSPGS